MAKLVFVNSYLEDERWLEAGPDAFVLHFAACAYADRKLTDGVISAKMVGHLTPLLTAKRTNAALRRLVDAGLWTQEGSTYRVADYLSASIGLSRDEQETNRERWAAGKKRQRMHGMGNHSLCDKGNCKYVQQVSAVDMGADTRESPRQSPLESPRLGSYSTRPDPTVREGEGEGSRGRQFSSAGATENSGPADSAVVAGTQRDGTVWAKPAPATDPAEFARAVLALAAAEHDGGLDWELEEAADGPRVLLHGDGPGQLAALRGRLG